WLAARETARSDAGAPAGDGRTGKGEPAERPRRVGGVSKARIERRLAELEAEIEALTAERGEIEARLAAPETYSDAGEIEQLSRRHGEITQKLAALEEEWTGLVDELGAG